MLTFGFLCLFSICVQGQFRINGTVTEIYDGQTVEVTDGRGTVFNVRLRAIEVPDEGQPLADIIFEHVTNLLLGKRVTFIVSTSGEEGFISFVLVDGVDVSQQLIRDGAAWLYLDEAGSAIPEEIQVYRQLEELAKNERRGIWGVSELIRPSEIRRIAFRSRNPLSDPETIKIARLGLGAAVEDIFEPEIFSVETGSCSGKVVGVSDGDTITILTNSNRTVKVRLAGIDAPEMSQSCGNASKQHLSDLVFGKHVSCSTTKRDRYGRLIGNISIGGVDINRQMIADGSAHHYKKYQHEQTQNERVSYANAEALAKNAGKGLWKDCTTPPWEYRRQRFLYSYTNTYSNSYYTNYTGGYSPSSQPSLSGGRVNVRGYFRNGTYVQPHTRQAPRGK